MHIAISTSQLIVGKTVNRNADGTLTVLRSLFGIIPDSLGDSLAAKAHKQVVREASKSSSLDAFMDAKDAVKREFVNIEVLAGAVVTAREPVEMGGVVYNAIHAGSLHATVDDSTVRKYESQVVWAAARKAAIDAE